MSDRLPNAIDRHVASRLRLRRLEAGLSQTTLADALGVAPAAVEPLPEKSSILVDISRCNASRGVCRDLRLADTRFTRKQRYLACCQPTRPQPTDRHWFNIRKALKYQSILCSCNTVKGIQRVLAVALLAKIVCVECHAIASAHCDHGLAHVSRRG
jgi:hypothetical protein